MKKTDQIFSERVVDGNLSADGAVGHGQQCGGKLDHRYTPEIACSDKTAKITDNAASNSKQVPAPVNISLNHTAIDAVRYAEAF